MEFLDFKALGADWIWNEGTGSLNSYAKFIHEFEVEEIKEIRLMISADTDYVVYVNGRMAGYGQYDDYPFYKVYDEIEIGSLVKKGRNRLCIRGYYQGVDSFQYYKADAGIIFAVLCGHQVLASSGENTWSSPCPAYESGPMENISPQLSFTFKYDASREDDWLDENYKTGNWRKSVVVNKNSKLHPRPVKRLITGERIPSRLCAQGLFMRDKEDGDIGLLMLRDYLSARRIMEMSDGKKDDIVLSGSEPLCIKQDLTEGKGVYLVFDLGREEAGLLDMEVEALEGTVFEIGYGEHLDDLRVRSYVGARNFACRYVSKEGRQSFTHYFKRLGCRYVQLNISNIKGDIKIYYAGVLPVRYPLTCQPVNIKDKLHKKIYEVAVRTLELCMHEHYEDCPWREQALYAMDSRNQALCGYYCFKELDFPQSCIRLLALGLQEDGLLELCAPARAPITIPSFTFLWVMELYEFWKHSHRTEFVKEMFETVEKICSSALERMEGGLIPCYRETRYWNFYEWAEGMDGTPIQRTEALEKRFDAPLNMLLVISLDSAAQLAEATGQQQLSRYWSECADKLRKAIREYFYDFRSGLYYTYIKDEKGYHLSELTQALAVCSGCAQGVEADSLRKVLASENNGLVRITLSYRAFKYDALLMDIERYRQWVVDDIAEIWGSMLFRGATSFWETEKGAADFDNAGSLCHGWSAIPVYYYHKLGIAEGK
ncbi:family 78 glycoside hydrolase catalytic domain [Pseudoclostridium thermosuccinogenes]|uniref:family 78 glycoside hydrolase catalytic domain n=1 Tax=Clostridium thermosuccinogenes TaxID=84032 RepID=UPI002FDA7CAE